MESKATLNYVRIAPRKVQIVLDLIRGKDVEMATAILKHTKKRACEPLLKLVTSAAANAENNHGMAKDDLFISQCFVSPGPILKRIMPRAKGRMYRINKRTSHITIFVKEREA